MNENNEPDVWFIPSDNNKLGTITRNSVFTRAKVINKSGHPLPAYETSGSAGMDLRACLTEDVVLLPMQRALIPTGLYIQLPPGLEAQIRPRSGLAHKHGVTVANAPGTIDSDYIGEVKVNLINLGDKPFTVENGERIAQMVVAAYVTVSWRSVEALDSTERGAGGHGSTGAR